MDNSLIINRVVGFISYSLQYNIVDLVFICLFVLLTSWPRLFSLRSLEM